MCTKLFRWNRAPLHASASKLARFRPNFSKSSFHCQKPQRLSSTLLNSEVQERFERKANKQTCPKDSIIFHNIWHSLHHLLYTNYRPLKGKNTNRHRTTRTDGGQLSFIIRHFGDADSKLAPLSTKLVYYLADRRSTLSGQTVNKRRLAFCWVCNRYLNH